MSNVDPHQAGSDPSRFRQAHRSTGAEVNYRQSMQDLIVNGAGTPIERLENFPKYTSRQTLARYLALYEIFKLALDVQGDVIECGVNWGGGLMAFAQCSAILEPFNLQRHIIGFDTFAGFPSIAAADEASVEASEQRRPGGYAAECMDELQRCVQLFDANRVIGHVEKIRLVAGDACQTIPEYLARYPQTVVSLLHLDFDIYEPTRVAIEQFLPRMPLGGVIIFDELNDARWPGETQAVAEAIGLGKLRIRRFPFEPYISYAVLGDRG